MHINFFVKQLVKMNSRYHPLNKNIIGILLI